MRKLHGFRSVYEFRYISGPYLWVCSADAFNNRATLVWIVKFLYHRINLKTFSSARMLKSRER